MYPELDLLGALPDARELGESPRRHDCLQLRNRPLEGSLLDGKPVGVGRRHHELAGLEANEDPGQDRS